MAYSCASAQHRAGEISALTHPELFTFLFPLFACPLWGYFPLPSPRQPAGFLAAGAVDQAARFEAGEVVPRGPGRLAELGGEAGGAHGAASAPPAERAQGIDDAVFEGFGPAALDEALEHFR